jgi:hypothetical protein
MSAPHRARSLLRVLACVAVSACSTSPTAPHDSIAVSGYVERGGTVTLSFQRGGTPAVPSSATWSATPASVMTIAAIGVAHLTDTGTVMITAHDGGSSASLALDVAAPPTILFDMQDSGGLGNRDVYSMTLDGEAITRLSSGTADNEQPASAGATVVFTSYRDGYATLYTVANTGGTETRLAGVPAPSAQAAVSADRSSIAFISPFNGADHLWTSAIDGSNATAATGGRGFSTALQASPNWSPSSDTLVVVTTQFGNASLTRLAVAEGPNHR